MKIKLGYLFITMLLGCSPSKSQNSVDLAGKQEKEPAGGPTKQELQRALGRGYVSSGSLRRDCIGRLTFDLDGAIQWPTEVGQDSSYIFSSLFSENIFDQGDGIAVQDVKIAVIGTSSPTTRRRLRDGMPWEQIVQNKERIEDSLVYLKRLRLEKIQSRRTLRDIEREESLIKSWQNSISETQGRFEVVSFPFPESEGYWTSEDTNRDGVASHSIFRAYLTRGNFVYVFESIAALTEQMTKKRHMEKFVEVVSRFRPRQPGEIPTELGVCFPHGFISDDGKMITDIKQSLRWVDAPGVIYSIQTGNSTSKNSKNAMIRALGTAAAAKSALAGAGGEKAVLLHQVGPVLTKIGALPASQGGFGLRLSKAGQAPFEVYDVFTGYSGWRGTAVLPFILIEMSTRTANQAPELTQNPPPFKQSMDRLETLLKSTRLRPTTPSMPELAELNEK